jgi:hypothetical protein
VIVLECPEFHFETPSFIGELHDLDEKAKSAAKVEKMVTGTRAILCTWLSRLFTPVVKCLGKAGEEGPAFSPPGDRSQIFGERVVDRLGTDGLVPVPWNWYCAFGLVPTAND